jgi:hypothetical protein
MGVNCSYRALYPLNADTAKTTRCGFADVGGRLTLTKAMEHFAPAEILELSAIP